jgi:transcriptional regulator with XRE-family HTH domain
MKTETPSVRPVVAVFPCAVCGAQLDLGHVEPIGHGRALCTFCGAGQSVDPSGALDDGSSQRPAPSDVGDTLREARRQRGESLEQASRATRVRESYLRALEEDEQSFEPFPGRVYARFFLREYAEYLGLDPEPLLRRFDHDALPALVVVPPTPLFRRAPRPRRWAIAALVVLVAMLGSAAVLNRDAWTSGGMNTSPSPPVSPDAPKQRAGNEPAVPPVTSVRAVISTQGYCWINVIADGKRLFQGTLAPGQRRSFRATHELHVDLGRPGVVEVTVNGKVQRFAGDDSTPVHPTWTIVHHRVVRT